MGKIAIIIVIIKLITGTGGASEAITFDAWPMPGYDACHTNSAPFGPKSTDLELEWTFKVDTDVIGYTNMICAKNNIYFGNKDGKIYCIEAANGKLKWTFETFCDPYAAPCYYENKLIVVCTPFFDKPNILCLDADTGKLLCGKRFNDRIINDFTVYNGRFYLYPYGEYLLCLDINNGEVIWSYSRENMYGSNPVIKDEKLYFSYSAGDAVRYKATVCLNAKNGQELWWNYDEDYFDLIITGDKLVGYNLTKIDCRSLTDGKLLWSINQENVIYICSSGTNIITFAGKLMAAKQMICIDALYGDIKWKVDTDFGKYSLIKPIVSNGVIFSTDRFYLYLIGIKDGLMIKELDLKATEPKKTSVHTANLLLTTNRIIVCTIDGKIHCYKGK